MRKTTYKKSSDICVACGEMGGCHYSTNGVSWCHSLKEREEHPDEPFYHTTFTYSKPDSNNPNSTFKRVV